LPSSVPEGELDVVLIDEDVVDVVFEDCGFAVEVRCRLLSMEIGLAY